MKTIQYTPDIQIDPPCLVLGMPDDIYHAWPGSISKSGLDLVSISPAHYRYQEARTPSSAMQMGTAVHMALLEPERFAAEYLLLRDVKDRRSSEYKQAAKVHAPDRILIAKDADRVAGMVESVRSQPRARDLLQAPGHREASLFVNDPSTGVLVRCRYDLITEDGRAVDLKKTQDARPDVFARSVYNYRYHVQAALYCDAWQWATGGALRSFEIIAVEEKMPHAAPVYQLDDEALLIGRELYRDALQVYADCVKSGDWHNYTSGDTELLSLPSWAVAQYENDIIDELV